MDSRAMKNTNLSEISGVPAYSVYRYMNGERAFSLTDLEKISKALNLNTSSILRQAEDALTQNPQIPEAAPAPPLSDAFIDQLQQDLIAGKYALATQHHEPNSLDGLGKNPKYTRMGRKWRGKI
ncbi:helix-turn-helix domain-containing protein [Arcanobacterium hippocoleae]